MTISQIKSLITPITMPDGTIVVEAPLVALNKASPKLSAKSKWNLSINLERAEGVARKYEEKRIELFREFAPVGAKVITPQDPGWENYKKGAEELLAVETDVKILQFDFADIVRDDLEISSDLIARLKPILVNMPAEE